MYEMMKGFLTYVAISYSGKFLMELIFKTFEDPMTLLKIKILKCGLYIGIDIN